MQDQPRRTALERFQFGIPKEGREAADHRDREVIDVRDGDWRDCADQNVAHHAADDRYHKRQKENAEQVEPLLYAQQSAAQGEYEGSHPVEHIHQILQEGTMHDQDRVQRTAPSRSNCNRGGQADPSAGRSEHRLKA
jgi:hypothetical protein